MSAPKLTGAQVRALRWLADENACAPNFAVRSLRVLERLGMARHAGFGGYQITTAGKNALAALEGGAK